VRFKSHFGYRLNYGSNFGIPVATQRKEARFYGVFTFRACDSLAVFIAAETRDKKMRRRKKILRVRSRIATNVFSFSLQNISHHRMAS
jgi:hypothetical protein